MMYFCKYHIDNITPIVIVNRPTPWKISLGISPHEFSMWAPYGRDYSFYFDGMVSREGDYKFLLETWLKYI